MKFTLITATPRRASLLASVGPLILPWLMSRSSSPTPDHPETLRWYRSLRQPAFKPPDALVPVAWAVIESALSLAAYRLARARPSAARNRSLALLAWNVGMIGGWSRLFFKRRQLATSAVAAVAMAATGAAYVREARPVDALAAKAGVPFVAWVAFASVLTTCIWRLNRSR